MEMIWVNKKKAMNIPQNVKTVGGEVRGFPHSEYFAPTLAMGFSTASPLGCIARILDRGSGKLQHQNFGVSDALGALLNG